MSYEVKFHKAVKKDIKKLHKAIPRIIREKYLPHLKKDPYRGELLFGVFRTLYSYHFTYAGASYRIIYEIEEDTKEITVLLIGARESLYERLKRRVS